MMFAGNLDRFGQRGHKSGSSIGKGAVAGEAMILANRSSRAQPFASIIYTAEAVTQFAAPTRTVLHVGCGRRDPRTLHATFKRSEWRELRLDIDPNVEPDIIASLIDMSMVDTATMDAVWSSHNLEHLYPHEVPLAMREFHRVLKPGGFALLTMPDVQAVAERIAQGNLEQPVYHSPAGPICPIDMLYGHRPSLARGNLYMAHHTAYTAQTLGRHLARAGFGRIEVKRRKWDLWAVAHK
jgi:SAM-dependent methyltransferase